MTFHRDRTPFQRPRQLFHDLLIGGSLRDAQSAGFIHCTDFKINLRCRRAGLMLMGHGPFSAAVDLAGGDGRGGFRQLTLWHDGTQDIPIDIARELELARRPASYFANRLK